MNTMTIEPSAAHKDTFLSLKRDTVSRLGELRARLEGMLALIPSEDLARFIFDNMSEEHCRSLVFSYSGELRMVPRHLARDHIRIAFCDALCVMRGYRLISEPDSIRPVGGPEVFRLFIGEDHEMTDRLVELINGETC